jgi:nociceptin receptor
VSDAIKLIVDTAYFVVILAIRIDPVFGARAYGYLYPYAHYFFNASLCTTAWLTVSVAADRYFLVCRAPTSWRALRNGARSVNRSRLVSVLVFVSMATLSVPFAIRYRTVHLVNDTTNETGVKLDVTELWTNEQFADGFVWFQNSIRSIIPLALLAVLNALILRVLLNSSSTASNPTATELVNRLKHTSEKTTSTCTAADHTSQPTAKQHGEQVVQSSSLPFFIWL